MTLIQFKNNKPAVKAFPSIFGDFFNDFMNDELVAKNVFRSVPAVNISENADSFAVELAIPGMEKSDFNINVENGVLSISAEKKEEVKDENKRFTRREFSYTGFNRTFTMPDQVNPEAITAEYTNGILKLVLPKREEAKQKPVRAISVS